MSLPSTEMEPFSNSIIRDKVRAIVDLPAPVRPQIPIFYPAWISKVRPWRTISVFGRYLNSTSVKTMWPLGGQSSPTSSPPATSAGILLTVISLWTDCIWVWKRFAVLNIRFAVLWTWRICCINRASATESISLLYEMQKANEIVTTADFKMTVSKLLRASTLYLI